MSAGGTDAQFIPNAGIAARRSCGIRRGIGSDPGGNQMDDNTFYIIVLVVFCLYNYFFSR